MANPPHIRVRPAAPADAEALQAIRYAAFQPTPISQGIWPGGMSTDAHQKAVAIILGEIESRGRGPKRVRVLVAEVIPAAADGTSTPSATSPDGSQAPAGYAAAAAAAASSLAGAEAADLLDDSTPAPIPGAQVVGYAKWHLYRGPRPAEEWDSDPPPMTQAELGEGSNLRLGDAFLGGLRRARRRVIRGDAHFILSFIATAPESMRLGAAGKLIRWGTSRADAARLNCWLEATAAGYQLYRRHGFEDVEVLDIDMVGEFGLAYVPGTDWGLANGKGVEDVARREGWYRTVLMKRAPRG